MKITRALFFYSFNSSLEGGLNLGCETDMEKKWAKLFRADQTFICTRQHQPHEQTGWPWVSASAVPTKHPSPVLLPKPIINMHRDQE